MVNMRIGGIAAALAFFLSLLIGLFSRASMPALLLRPAVFAFIFFALSCLVHFAVSRFLPELLDKGDPVGDIIAGSRVNITEAAPPPTPQAFFGAQADDSGEDLGNISDLVAKRGSGAPPAEEPAADDSTGMDQNRQNGYNNDGNLGDFFGSGSLPKEPPPQAEIPRSGAGSSGAGSPKAAGGAKVAGAAEGFPDSVDILPDLDSMAGAFLPVLESEESDAPEYSVSTPAPPKPSSGGKAPAWAGDFNAKDMAAGLRTVLSKEKEG